MSNEEIDLESLRGPAERAGLGLSEDELVDLSVGVKRNEAYAEAVRRYLRSDLEPGLVFKVAPPADVADSSRE